MASEKLSYFDQLQEACTFIKEKIPNFDVQIFIALGSGLQAFGSSLENATIIPYSEIPNFPGVRVKGHSGRLIHGTCCGNQIMVFQGRVHLYEDYTAKECCFYVRMGQLLGCRDFFVTNAAGCANLNWSAGDFMIISDHINMTGKTPLGGKHEPRLGKNYFVDMSEVYDKNLRKLLRTATSKVAGNFSVHEGVYCANHGPQYETPSEVKMCAKFGADALGMSTVPEVTAARHGGLRCIGMSLLTNMGAGLSSSHLNHEEVVEMGKNRADAFVQILLNFFQAYFETSVGEKRASKEPARELKRPKLTLDQLDKSVEMNGSGQDVVEKMLKN